MPRFFINHILLLTFGVCDGPSAMVVTALHKHSSDTAVVKSNLVFVRVSSVGGIVGNGQYSRHLR